MAWVRMAARTGGRRTWPLILLVALVLASILLAGCDTSGALSASPRATHTATATASAPTRTSTPGAGSLGVRGVGVFVEPDAGEKPILDAIKGATRSIWVEVYLLTDTTILHALEDAAGRGVDVRVLLEDHPFGGGSVSPTETLQALNAAGVQAKPSDPAYHFTHEKALIVDGATAYILTCNLSRAGLGGNSSTANREYGVIDTHGDDVAALRAIFEADWNRTDVTVNDPNLVVSPVNSRAKITALLASARHTLQIEDEEMVDTASEDALIAAAKRGVNVQIVMPQPSSSGADDVARLVAGGVHVRYIKAPYMHAKLIVADGALAFVGSENFSATSLDENREVGLLIADTGALDTFTHTFALDWAVAADA